jgi:hypothetical protein
MTVISFIILAAGGMALMFDLRLAVSILQQYSSRQELQAAEFAQQTVRKIFASDPKHADFHDQINLRPGTIAKILAFTQQRFGAGALYFRLWEEMGGAEYDQHSMNEHVGRYRVHRYIPLNEKVEHTQCEISRSGDFFIFEHTTGAKPFTGPALNLGNRVYLLGIGHSYLRMMCFHPSEGRKNHWLRGLLMTIAERNDRLFCCRFLLCHEDNAKFHAPLDEALNSEIMEALRNDVDDLGIIYTQ